MSKVVLLTGGNTGLGYQTIVALLSSPTPYKIYFTSRTLASAETARQTLQDQHPTTSSTLHPLQCDIENDAEIAALYKHIEAADARLDVLVNNAGAQLDPQYQAGALTERQMWDKTWSVNVTSTQILTTTFLPLLFRASAPRLLFITSGTSTLAGTENLALFVNKLPSPEAGRQGLWPKENAVRGVPAYRSAKTGLNMMMREFHRLLKLDGVKVFAISPGFLATNLGGHAPEKNAGMGAGDPAEGANLVRQVVEGERDADAGKIVLRDGNVQDW